MATVDRAHPVHAQWQVSVYHVESTPYQRLRAEIAHPHWAISHVAAGDVWTIADGHECHAPGGSVMVHAPGRPYGEYAERPGRHEWVIFEARSPANRDLLCEYSLPAVLTLQVPNAFSAQFASLLAAWHDLTPLRDALVFTRAASLLAELLSGHYENVPQSSPTAGQAAERWTDLIHWMSLHLARRVTRSELADVAGLQPNYFDRVFRAAYGLPPMAMLRRLRLQRARHLLERTDNKIEAIAIACGFADASQLTRHFVRHVGRPPGVYRAGVKRARESYAAP